MPDGHSLLLFILAGLALNVTPGPDMLYVAARSSAEGRRAGIVSALGIGAGTLVNIAVAFGASALRSRLLSGQSGSSNILGRAVGVLFVGLGVRVAVSR